MDKWIPNFVKNVGVFKLFYGFLHLVANKVDFYLIQKINQNEVYRVFLAIIIYYMVDLLDLPCFFPIFEFLVGCFYWLFQVFQTENGEVQFSVVNDVLLHRDILVIKKLLLTPIFNVLMAEPL